MTASSTLTGDGLRWNESSHGHLGCPARLHIAQPARANRSRTRGRGAGAVVTWAATLADPNRPAVLLASDDGRPIYARMGYVAVERWTAWLRLAR